MDTVDLYQTTIKHNQTQTVCIILGMHCILFLLFNIDDIISVFEVMTWELGLLGYAMEAHLSSYGQGCQKPLDFFHSKCMHFAWQHHHILNHYNSSLFGLMKTLVYRRKASIAEKTWTSWRHHVLHGLDNTYMHLVNIFIFGTEISTCMCAFSMIHLRSIHVLLYGNRSNL